MAASIACLGAGRCHRASLIIVSKCFLPNSGTRGAPRLPSPTEGERIRQRGTPFRRKSESSVVRFSRR